MDRQERLQVIRYKLASDKRTAYYGLLMQSLGLYVSAKSIAPHTDGKSIVFGEEFMDNHDDLELVFVMAHEVQHVTDMHIQRFLAVMLPKKDSMSEKEWREEWDRRGLAADYLINYRLVKEGIGKMPADVYYDPDLNDNMTVEQIYEKLLEREGGGSGGNKGQSGLDDHTIWITLDADGQPTEDEVMEKIIGVIGALEARDANDANMKNSSSSAIPSYMKNIVHEYLTPQVSWEDELNLIVSEHGKKKPTWSKFNRRMLSGGLYLPHYKGGNKARFCIARDVSGSISTSELNLAAGECRFAVENLQEYDLYLIDFSHVVHSCKKFTQADELDTSLEGNGGTDLSVITEYLEKHEIEVDSLFVITDGVTSLWPNPEYCEETTFIMTTGNIAPFGKTINVTL